jgi:hypothetical protein
VPPEQGGWQADGHLAQLVSRDADATVFAALARANRGWQG